MLNSTRCLLILCLISTPCLAQKLPRPDVGFGFFYSPGRCTIANERAYLIDMRDHGCNTFAPQANELPGETGHTAEQNLARQLNTAAEVGLTDPHIPVICYSVQVCNVVAVKKLRRPSLRWPELVVQSIDEPNHTQEATLRQYHDEAHAAKIRIGTAVAGYVCTGYNQQLPWCAPEDEGKPVPAMGQYLDIWIVLVGTLSQAVQDLARKQGADVGGYLAYPSSPILDRWTFGLWAWKARTKTNLLWAYIDKTPSWDYGRVIETAAGPMYGPGGAGYAEGITDYRVLQAVRDLHTKRGDQFLGRVDDEVSLGWWPRGYVKDNQHLEVPTVNMDKVRERGMKLLRETR